MGELIVAGGELPATGSGAAVEEPVGTGSGGSLRRAVDRCSRRGRSRARGSGGGGAPAAPGRLLGGEWGEETALELL